MKRTTLRDWIDPVRLHNPRMPAGRLMWLWGSYVLPGAISLTIILSTLLAVGFVEGVLGYTEASPIGDMVEGLLTVAVIVASSFAWILMSIRRFKDLGHSPWNALLVMLPVVNLGILGWLMLGTGIREPAPATATTDSPLPAVVTDTAKASPNSGRNHVDADQPAGSDRPHERPAGRVKLVDTRLWIAAIGIGLTFTAIITAINVARATLMSSGAVVEPGAFLGALASNAFGNLLVFGWLGLPAAWAHRALSRRYSSLTATAALVIVGVVTFACIGGYALLPLDGAVRSDYYLPEAPPDASSSPVVAASKEATQDLCSWYLMTQILRTKRVSGQSELIEFIQKHGMDLSATEELELVDVLLRYQPYQWEFISDWEELGSHPEAEEFWQKEWDSVMLKIVAIDGMQAALKQNDPEHFRESWDLFINSQDVGQEAESAMLDVRAKCLD